MSVQMKKMAHMSDEELFSFLQYDSRKAEEVKSSGYSYWRSTFQMFMKSKLTRFTLYFLIALLAFTFIQPFLPGQKNPTEIFLNPETGRQLRSLQPNAQYWFGTNTIGQDLWARVWSGTRTTMFIGSGFRGIQYDRRHCHRHDLGLCARRGSRHDGGL